MKKYDLLILGGDAAGMSAASQARRIDPSISIGVFDKGEYVSYAACGMPYYISGRVKESKNLIAINKEDFIKNRKIEIYNRHEAVKADFSAKSIMIKSDKGTDTYQYSRLIIATGAKPFIPPIKGIENDNIFFLRNLSDGIAIKEFIKSNSPKSCVIIGGGFIGLEMAESLHELNIKSTILEKMDSIASAMSPEIKKRITKKIKEKNIDVHTEVDIDEIQKSDQGLTVNCGNFNLNTDFIIVSVGIVPCTDFLSDTGLNMNERGAILIDEESKTNIPEVYAAGDCATVKNLITGKDVYMPLGTTANKQGRVAGLQSAGIKNEHFNGIVGTQFVKIFDLEAGKTGFNSSDAERAGIKSESISTLWKSRAGYCPEAQRIVLIITINSETRAIIGAEAIGAEGAVQRINVIAIAVTSGMTIDDFAYVDLGYAPPFAPVWDVLLAGAQKFIKRDIED